MTFGNRLTTSDIYESYIGLFGSDKPKRTKLRKGTLLRVKDNNLSGIFRIEETKKSSWGNRCKLIDLRVNWGTWIDEDTILEMMEIVYKKDRPKFELKEFV